MLDVTAPLAPDIAAVEFLAIRLRTPALTRLTLGFVRTPGAVLSNPRTNADRHVSSPRRPPGWNGAP